MWKEIIIDLVTWGLSEREIAAQVGLSQPQINRLKHGRRKSVRHETGELLRKLHKQASRPVTERLVAE